MFGLQMKEIRDNHSQIFLFINDWFKAASIIDLSKSNDAVNNTTKPSKTLKQ